MRARICIVAALMLVLAGPAPPAGAEPVRIGFLATLSGPSAAPGEDMRDGFLLALKELGGRLGGLDAQVSVVDDRLDPDGAALSVRRLIEEEHVHIIVGAVLSNVLTAIYAPVVESGTFLIGTDGGPAAIAGRSCSPYFFSTSWQNDALPAAMGRYAAESGYRRMIVMAPDYSVGTEVLTAFRSRYEGEVIEEMRTGLGQLDFSAELARIAAAKPDAFFTFMPGSMGVRLVQQYHEAGLAELIPFLSAFTLDETALRRMKDAAVGFYAASQWAPDLDNAANRAFVPAFEAEYNRPPSLYAAQGYDAARLIESALGRVGGRLADKDALRAALKAADFASVRGNFTFNGNGFPIEDFYAVKVTRRADGAYVTETVKKVFEALADPYAEACGID